MAKSLASLRRVKADKPPFEVIYGIHGFGKTTLASEHPDTVFIQTEKGTPGGVELTSFGHIETFSDVLDSMAALLNEPHNFKNVALDSGDAMEPMIWREVCEENKWDSIESPGYGKGYILVDEKWRELITYAKGLTEAGIGFIFIAHSDITKFNDPVIGEYSRYGIKLHKRAAALVQEAADIVCFCNYRVSLKTEEKGFNKTTRGVGGGSRMLFFEERPGFLAKNRYQMPESIEYRAGRGYEAVAKYFPQPTGIGAVQQAAE